MANYKCRCGMYAYIAGIINPECRKHGAEAKERERNSRLKKLFTQKPQEAINALFESCGGASPRY